MGSYGQAIEDYNTCIRLDPENQQVFYKRGIVNYIAGYRDAACKDLEKSAALGNQEAYDIIRLYCR
jgi:lipoprotein NlpI